MKKHIYSIIKHILMFVLIEALFVLLIFRELHIGDRWTYVGLLHLSYRIVVLGAGRLRLRYNKVRQKFLTTYVPIVYHLAIHVVMAYILVDQHLDIEGEHHDHELFWLILATILSGGLIRGGEYLLHRQLHCATHHHHVHKDCHDKHCDTPHT